ncbi:hypothetical protein GCM10009119_04070 [Algoriphagus jejuensis]|uniref:Uncharacterized protein n=1 Tax=Algoriphagus jejuensis TaxID=419934 RepID=A0ABN1MVL9_9BACT
MTLEFASSKVNKPERGRSGSKIEKTVIDNIGEKSGTIILSKKSFRLYPRRKVEVMHKKI